MNANTVKLQNNEAQKQLSLIKALNFHRKRIYRKFKIQAFFWKIYLYFQLFAVKIALFFKKLYFCIVKFFKNQKNGTDTNTDRRYRNTSEKQN